MLYYINIFNYNKYLSVLLKSKYSRLFLDVTLHIKKKEMKVYLYQNTIK